MIERHVTFEVLQGKEEAFEQFFVQEYRPAMSQMAGFVRVELLRDQETPWHYQMSIRFDSVEAAAAWRASRAHQALSPRFKTLYSGSQVQVYDSDRMNKAAAPADRRPGLDPTVQENQF